MPISNTAPLTRADIDAMNEGLRAFSLSARDSNRLADYFQLSERTVQRWFAVDGQQYRRCIPLTFTDAEGTQTTVGQRIFLMFDENDPDNGFGDGDAQGGERIYQSLRLRCFLGACLGVDGGLYRSLPVYNGTTHTMVRRKNTIDECLQFINAIYTGNADHAYFMVRAWISFVISPFIGQNNTQSGWTVTVTYNEPDSQESDAEETAEPGT